MADAKRNYKVLEYDDEKQGLAPMAVGAEAAGKGGHSTGCVFGAVIITILLCLLVLGGSTQTDLLSQIGVCEPIDEICETPACVELASELLTNMNTTVDPCVDFFEYTCGGWIQKNPLPDDKTRISTFDQLADAGKTILKRELESNTASGTVQKAVRYYAACMDTDAIDSAGAAPLDELLADVGLTLAEVPLTAMSAVPYSLARLHNRGGSALLDLYVSGDDHDSTSNAVFVSQGGLSLPSRDYYIDKDIETDPTLQALVNHIANANHLADPATVPSAAAYFPQAAAIVALESSLATAQLSRVAMRDPEVLREPSPFLSHFYKCYTETHKINKTCSGQT
jgi:predicted metalloendopeptidase